MMNKGVYLVLIILLFFMGCYPPISAKPVASQAPIPTSYYLSKQQKMKAIYHWELLAENTVAEIKEGLKDKFIENKNSIYVAPSGITPFEKAFHELLITCLVDKGINVSNSPRDNFVLMFDIQLVAHSQGVIKANTGVYKSLASGFFVRKYKPFYSPWKSTFAAESSVKKAELNVEAGEYTIELPENEIMITTSLMYNDTYIKRSSAIYYIEDLEWSNYIQKTKMRRVSTSNYKLVNE
jgi:hypothetical protein